MQLTRVLLAASLFILSAAQTATTASDIAPVETGSGSAPDGPPSSPDDFIPSKEYRLPNLDQLPAAPGEYQPAPLRWFGQAAENGPNITIVGRDLDQILGKLRELNPDFDAWNKRVLERQKRVQGAVATEPGTALKRRNSGTGMSLNKRYDFVREIDGAIVSQFRYPLSSLAY